MIDPEEIHPTDIAPDSDEDGDDLPTELADFVTEETHEIVPDNVDEKG